MQKVTAPGVIYRARDFFNKNLFEGKLSPIPIYLINQAPCTGGAFYYDSIRFDEQRIAFLRSEFSYGTRVSDYIMLAHELSHQWHDPEGGHSQGFIKTMEAIGLTYTPYGDHVIRGGAFEKWCGIWMGGRILAA